MFDLTVMKAMGVLLGHQARDLAKTNDVEVNEIIDISALLTKWKPGVYEVGDVVQQNYIPYKCRLEHDSTEVDNWSPEEAPSLWKRYHGTDAKHALPYEGDGTEYDKGEYMVWTDDQVYRCEQNATVWGPDTLPDNWTLIY